MPPSKQDIKETNRVKFPHVKVKLTGQNGNAFMVMGLTVSAMKKAKVPKEDIQKYQDDAMSGDYDHLLGVTMMTVNVE